MSERYHVKWTFDGHAYRKKNTLPKTKEVKLTAKCLSRIKEMVNELTERTGYHPLVVMDCLEHAVTIASMAGQDELEAQTGIRVGGYTMGVPTKDDILDARIRTVAANIVANENTPERIRELLQPIMSEAQKRRYHQGGNPHDMWNDIEERLSQHQTQWIIEVMQRCAENKVDLDDLLIQES